MAEGLTTFSEALVEHGLKERSKKNGETIEQAIKREISDMSIFLLEINKIGDSEKRMITEGLVRYIIGFYLSVRKNKIENYKKLIREIIDYFLSMDRKFYDELEGQPDDMKKLAEYLDTIKV